MNVYVKYMLGVRTNASGVRRLHLPGHRTPAYVRRSWEREAALRTNLALRPEKGSVHAGGPDRLGWWPEFVWLRQRRPDKFLGPLLGFVRKVRVAATRSRRGLRT